MPSQNTPPASPAMELPAELSAEDEEAAGGPLELDQEDIVEVIDLDELESWPEEIEVADEDDDEDDHHHHPQDQPMDRASAGSVVKPVVDLSERTFDKHAASVFTVALHPKNAHLAASGGEDDLAYVWNTHTGEVVLKCDGFKDSVVFVAFSQDGTYLAAADMAGVIKVWKVATQELTWEFETSDITWISWHGGANVLFATTVDSELWMWKIPSGESKIYSGHGERAESAKILPDGKRAIVGYGDGSMRLFDLKTADVVHNLSGNAGHSASVTSIAVRSDNNLIGTGGVDGSAKLFNTQSGKNIGTFMCGTRSSERDGGDDEDVDSKSTVESILFSKPEMNLMLTGTLEGTVNIWDLASQVSRQAFSVGTGITKMEWRQGSHTEVLVATLDGLVRLADIRMGKVLADFSGHSASILDFAQSSDGSILLTSSDDGTCKVFNVTKIVEST